MPNDGLRYARLQPLICCSFAAGVQVAVEAGKVAAADLDAKLVSRREVVAGLRRLERNFVDFAFFHPFRLRVSFAIADALNIFVNVISRTVRQHFNQFYSKVCIFRIAET